MDIKDRIRQLMIAQHMTQQSFAGVLGISTASLSSIFNDRTKPTLNHVMAIKDKFPSISLEWLVNGKEPMYADGTTGSSTATNPAKSVVEPQLNFDDPDTQPPIDHVVIDSRPSPPVVKIVEKPQRKITEIRIFYDDQTWESFLPKKRE